MPVFELLSFQQQAHDGLLARFLEAKRQMDQLGTAPKTSALDTIRKNAGAILFQAPTGSGKTLIATRVVASLSEHDSILWLWFAPFAGVVDQTRQTLHAQAPTLSLLDLESDRRLDALGSAPLFVTTWQSVATSNKEGRKARISGDAGLAVDELIAGAREAGYRIGCVVDEAHHGFKKAAEARRFFAEVLRPDYTLMMTATPKDSDARAFARETGYEVGDEASWASVSRSDGVEVGLLKKGVKMARFIVRNPDDTVLVDFERTALRECAAMHRQMKDTLAREGVALTPLMLVQVPNGGEHIDMARGYLTGKLGFSEQAVRVHIANEPDPDLLALANDPRVEVLIFKMAVAMGFDAPRAWTLAAMRGARDASFGVQVVGRIMRRHRSVHARRDLPDELEYGYVFLANSEAQEGLLSAGDLINRMPTHVAELGSQTVVTFVADEPEVQIVRNGESLRLFADGRVEFPDPPSDGGASLFNPASPGHQQEFLERTGWTPMAKRLQGNSFASSEPTATLLTSVLANDTHTEYTYRRRPDGPTALLTESMPPLPDDFEEQVAAQIDFTAVLSDRERVRTKIVQRTQNIFEDGGIVDEEKWATLSPEVIAAKAKQLVFQFDVDRFAFPRLLRNRFRKALENHGIEPPADEEQLLQQLDLILVRNPKLIAEAVRKCRAAQLAVQQVTLPEEISSELRLSPAKRNLYGIFPADLNSDERRFAELLDIDDDVLWWHRNPSQQPTSICLYGWSHGRGFFPDFLVAVKGRLVGQGLALVEVKGPQLQHYDRAKASARHREYGSAFMVGYDPGKKSFLMFREENGQLYENGTFEVARLRFDQ
ncbi:MAG: helicase SNF2 [Deltaproteobacteria bacterium]|nr:MAG: helicase SNF2 [Deltaproteobacteria bacterium]